MMMDAYDKQDGYDREENNDIYSKPVRAGKRTYFFDVKATKSDDYYLTITESKKRIGKDGRFFYDKHKIFLYKEDFEKFADGLQEVVDYIRGAQGSSSEPGAIAYGENISELADVELSNSFATIDFEDLDKR